ncbi:acetate--CoA ligase family protein [Thermodesulfobacteriota bacterium]
MKNLNLDRLFNPRHVAMIGASDVPGKWGFSLLFNILQGNYDGKCCAVNPKKDIILSVPSYPSIIDAPDTVDVAIITTPAHTVPEIIEQCGRKGVPNVIVVSSGFSEAGAEGASMERELVSRAERYGMRIVGPNTMGIFSARSRFHAMMPSIEPLHGGASMFAQSGNVGTQMAMRGIEEGLGFEKFVSSGNEGDLTCVDYIRYFGRDKATHVIMGYLEGVDSGSEFISAAAEISREKPIIILKGGRTGSGMKAAASHTGALAGSLDIYEAVFRKTGIVHVATTNGVIDCAKAFSEFPLPRGKRVAILTRGGGWGVITSDCCEEIGLEVPPLSDDIMKKMNKILPSYWSRGNPIDLAGITGFDPFLECLEIVAHWDGADAVIGLGGRTGTFFRLNEKEDFLERIQIDRVGFEKMEGEARAQEKRMSSLARHLIKETGKPIMFVDLASKEDQLKSIEELRAISYANPERAVRALKWMYDYKMHLESLP